MPWQGLSYEVLWLGSNIVQGPEAGRLLWVHASFHSSRKAHPQDLQGDLGLRCRNLPRLDYVREIWKDSREGFPVYILVLSTTYSIYSLSPPLQELCLQLWQSVGWPEGREGSFPAPTSSRLSAAVLRPFLSQGKAGLGPLPDSPPSPWTDLTRLDLLLMMV